MKALILAAGEGSRMRPLTYTRPKAMLPLANKPLLEHLLLRVAAAGIKEFVFVIGYQEENVHQHFGDGSKWGVSIEYCRQEQQLGTADAIKTAARSLESRFMVLNGDILVNGADIAKLAASVQTTMCLFEVENAEGLGVVEVSGQNVRRIYEKAEKPPSKLANTGIYIFTSDIFKAIEKTPKSERGEYELTDSLQILIDSGQTVGWQEIKNWQDLSYPWDMLGANAQLLAEMKAEMLGKVEEGAVLKGEVSVGQGSLVRSGSYIEGPVAIGDNCDIGPNCYIRPSTAIGNGCRIGAAVEVKNSIVMNGAKIPHHNYVGDSIIGEGCNLGSGTKIANLRLDKGEIVVSGIATGRRKLGAILGDNVETGINSGINTGTLVGNNVFIGPGVIAHGVIAPKTKITRAKPGLELY